MSYLQDRRNKKKRTNIIIIFVLILLFIILSIAGVFSGLGRIFHFLGNPIWKSKNNIVDNVDSSKYIVHTKRNVFKQNEFLKSENTDLKNKMIDYEMIERENKTLKDLLNRIENPSEYILSRVLSKPGKSPYDTLVIDIGSNYSLFDGQKVYASPAIPIGEIIEIYDKTALVKLYSSPDEITDAEIDTIGISVELLGRGGGNFEINTPKELSLDNGTQIVIPGLTSKILAIVVDTISEEKDPTNKIILKSPINIQELKWVQVLK